MTYNLYHIFECLLMNVKDGVDDFENWTILINFKHLYTLTINFVPSIALIISPDMTPGELTREIDKHHISLRHSVANW
jgi:hypothetical protein